MASLLDKMRKVHRGETRLPSIHEVTRANVECPICGGEGWVCENHPDKAWDTNGCECGAGQPCRCTPYMVERETR